jgi:hypothetical protein
MKSRPAKVGDKLTTHSSIPALSSRQKKMPARQLRSSGNGAALPRRYSVPERIFWLQSG